MDEYSWYLKRSLQGLWVGINLQASLVFSPKDMLVATPAVEPAPQMHPRANLSPSYRSYQMVCQRFHQLNLHV